MNRIGALARYPDGRVVDLGSPLHASMLSLARRPSFADEIAHTRRVLSTPNHVLGCDLTNRQRMYGKMVGWPAVRVRMMEVNER